MKKQTDQSRQFLVAITIMLGACTSIVAQPQNKYFALNNLSPVTVSASVCWKDAPQIFKFDYTEPNSWLVTNFNRYDDFPKPDFSAMEQWYEIVKYDYDFSATFHFPLIIVVVKKKVQNAPISFKIGWFDADGVRIGIDANLIPVQGNLNLLAVGEAFRLRAYAPAEKDMSKVKTTVVKRVLD
jgi:hypothetical protein